MSHHKRLRGVTLIEILGVMLILGIVGAIVCQALSRGFELYAASGESLAAQQHSLLMLNRIMDDVRFARRVDVTEDGVVVERETGALRYRLAEGRLSWQQGAQPDALTDAATDAEALSAEGGYLGGVSAFSVTQDKALPRLYHIRLDVRLRGAFWDRVGHENGEMTFVTSVSRRRDDP